MVEAEKKFVVRMWDAAAGRWSTLTEPLPETEADRHYNEYTMNGTVCTGEHGESYYYMVFPVERET